MTKIKKLSPQEAQKIAAGEVVERPANIVKELLENSLDAGSTQISIYVEDGGKKLIKIVDNGSGMSPEDSVMSIEHHATSKITKVEDLESLRTFGFRGEALSSISAVSLMSIKTKTEELTNGIKLDIEWAKVTGQEIVSCNTGTEITVQNIFENIPARKKFLKTKETELRAIIQLFFAAVLSYKTVSFKFFSENRLIYNCPAVTDIKSRIAQLFDNNLVNNIITNEFEDQKNKIKISCAVTGPEYTRYDRSSIFYFVNSRWVKNYKLSQATLKGYMNVLPENKYPAAFIFIEIDPKLIDVNIHPRKDEVLFFNPKIVENCVETCVRLALEKYLSNKIKPANLTSLDSLNISKKFEINNLQHKVNFGFYKQDLNNTKFSSENFNKTSNYNNSQNIDSQRENIVKIIDQNFEDSFKNIANQDNNLQNKIFIQDLIPNNINNNSSDSSINNLQVSQENLRQESFKIVGQLFKTYILIEVADGMLMVDQHAAHERILYERFSGKFENLEKIDLVVPVLINLLEQDINIILENQELFKNYGFNLDQFSNNQIIVKSSPVILQKESVLDLIKFILEILKEYGTTENLDNHIDIVKKITERVHAQMACKAAVKSGDSLNSQQMESIIHELYLTQNRFTCPHGRPTFWHCNLSDINKKFKRPNISG